MPVAADFVVVMTTCPTAEVAETIGRRLVEAHLAACVQVLPAGKSFYTWQGQMETAAECLLLIKTRRALCAAVEQAVKDWHPYELPEIVAVPMVGGSTDYLVWLTENTREPV